MSATDQPCRPLIIDNNRPLTRDETGRGRMHSTPFHICEKATRGANDIVPEKRGTCAIVGTWLHATVVGGGRDGGRGGNASRIRLCSNMTSAKRQLLPRRRDSRKGNTGVEKQQGKLITGKWIYLQGEKRDVDMKRPRNNLDQPK